MPKFLDAPSWYDDDGNLKTIQGTYTIGVLGGWGSTIEVPYVGGANTEYLSHVSGRTLVPQGSAVGQIPCWYGGSVGFQNIAAGSEKGQVLTWNGGHTSPSWASLEPVPPPGVLYCAERANYDGNHPDFYYAHDINGTRANSGAVGHYAVVTGKDSTDKGSTQVIKNRIVKITGIFSTWVEAEETNYFLAPPEKV